MSGPVFFYALLAVVLLLYVRRYLERRSITEYSASQLDEKLKSDRGLLLLDVRTQREWNSGHIKSAHHIPLPELTRRMDELEKHKNREIICYCQTGTRSLAAAARLKKFGFTVAHLRGGIAEWNFRSLR